MVYLQPTWPTGSDLFDLQFWELPSLCPVDSLPYAHHYNSLLNTNHTSEETERSKKTSLKKEMELRNGVKNIQTASYNGSTVYTI